MAHWLCVCVVLLVGIGSLEIAHGFLFPTSSVAPSSPSCVGGSTESDLTLVCNLQYQLTHLLHRYKNSSLAFNPVFYGTELNNTLTATDDCRLPFHKQLNVYNHLFDRVRGLYTPTNRKFTRLTNRTTQAIASLQDKLKESCKADGEDACSDMNRNQIPAEASNAAIRTDEGEDAANDWGLVLVETLLKRLEPLDNGCSGSSRRKRRRGERKDRTKKNRRRGGRKNRRQKKDKKADEKTKDRSEKDKKADEKTKDRSGKRGGRAERREKRRRNRKNRVDDDNSTEVNNTITATTTNTNTTTTNNNDNNDKVVTDASEHAVGISTNDVEQVNINVDNGKDSRSSDSDGKRNRRNRRRDRRNKNKRRNRKTRDKKRRKSKGRRNRRRKSSSS